jgi:lipopolysaccharide export system permease protein
VLRIQRELLAELLLSFVLSALVVTAVVFLGVMLRFVRDGGGALGAAALWTLLPNMAPVALSYSVPFAWLTATAFVVGRWSSDHEFMALSTAGVHLRTLAVPVIAFGILLGVAGMYYNGWEVPVKNREMRARLRDYLPRFLSSLRGTERSVAFDRGRLSFERWDEESRRLLGVELDRRNGSGHLQEKVVAASLRLEHVTSADGEQGLRLGFDDAFVMSTPRGGAEMSWRGRHGVVVGHVQRVGASVGFNEFFGGQRWAARPRDLTISELFYANENRGMVRGTHRDIRIALHGRLASGAAALFLGLFALSMALALPPSSHRVRDFVITTAPAVLTFYPLQIAGPTLARSGSVPPWLIMWLPNILLLAGSVVLLRKAFRR